jgi:prolipoprotein diacylglyceryltransferase
MFERCYPTLSDMLLDLTGIHIPLPIFSYGFCLALGFLAAAFTLSLELKRKEEIGLLKTFKKQITTGEVTVFQFILNGILGFVIGYKLILVFIDYSRFASDPQGLLKCILTRP